MQRRFYVDKGRGREAVSTIKEFWVWSKCSLREVNKLVATTVELQTWSVYLPLQIYVRQRKILLSMNDCIHFYVYLYFFTLFVFWLSIFYENTMGYDKRKTHLWLDRRGHLFRAIVWRKQLFFESPTRIFPSSVESPAGCQLVRLCGWFMSNWIIPGSKTTRIKSFSTVTPLK